MDRTTIKARINQCIDAHKDEIIALGEDVCLHPELGYKETRTAGLVSEHLKKTWH